MYTNDGISDGSKSAEGLNGETGELTFSNPTDVDTVSYCIRNVTSMTVLNLRECSTLATTTKVPSDMHVC